MHTELKVFADEAGNTKSSQVAKVLNYEFERLAKQKCAYCDGFGHSGNDCPTDRKVFQLRGGISEFTTVLQNLRKECRAKAGMGAVKGFSMLSADPKKTLGKKRIRGSLTETSGDSDDFGLKRRKR